MNRYNDPSATPAIAPPSEDFSDCVAFAVEEAAHSPCCKSRRGVVIFDDDGSVLSLGHNGPPRGFRCGAGEDAFAREGPCEASCNRVAVHAEERAIIRAPRASDLVGPSPLCGAHLLHVKISIDGELVASGPPSCWQCSRMIVEAGIADIWLYHGGEGTGWMSYPARTFHAITLRGCKLPVYESEDT